MLLAGRQPLRRGGAGRAAGEIAPGVGYHRVNADGTEPAYSPLPSGERVARRAGEGDVHGGTSGKSAPPSP
ncbi:hypothetical protein D3867_21435 (plasmid) [Azospirillum argentinense]|uniref:Uncharacterized protein n=1 Tax=Azospirillum brasilense TaxID=192 RepID=A0A4D8Q9C7_AZOBR|nr:hypothetical protein D3867_21435 [Azospirillum argentinense]